jgi:ribulose kinase
VSLGVADAAAAAGKKPLAYLDDLASKIPPGSEGLMVLEHWQGSRCPWVDSNSRGAIRGLTLLHRPEHLYRAIMEGVAFGTALILDRMGSAGVPVEELRVCGGPSRSELWMQIHADVAGKPILLPREPESVLLGSAILAALGAGLYPSLGEAADAMSGTADRVLPDPGRHAVYRRLLARYVATYEALKPLNHAEAKEIPL